MKTKILTCFNGVIVSLKKCSIKQILYSFGIACICWYVISSTVYTNMTKTISNVPLVIDTTGTSVDVNGLSVVSQDVENVTVRISGDRGEIGNLKASDLQANAIVENITEAGTYTISINVSNADGKDTDFKVESIQPNCATVQFDKYISKDIPVVVNSPNIKAEDGYIMDKDTPKATPSTITINGPQSQVDNIEEFKVDIDQEKLINNYYTYHSTDAEEWSLCDENHGEVDVKNVTYNVTDIQVDYQAYQTKTLSLKYSLINNANNVQPKFIMSDSEIMVASSDSSLESTNEIDLGEIDMRDVGLDFTKTFEVSLPTSYQNISGIDTVTISLDKDAYEEKEFYNLSNFVITNAPEDYDIQVITSSITADVICNKYQINTINADDFVLKIDLSNTQITGNLINVPVMIQVSSHSDAWCVGRYMAVIKATDKVEETTTVTSNYVQTFSNIEATSTTTED